MTVEALAPQSTRLPCPYCPNVRSTDEAIAKHVAQCWRNPATRSCVTCANFRPATYLADAGCGVGVDLDSGEPYTALPINCSEWEVVW